MEYNEEGKPVRIDAVVCSTQHDPEVTQDVYKRQMLVLYNLISVNQKEDMPMNVGAVKEIIDNAIAKSTGGIRKLSRNISKKRTDMDGYTVLYEKDFK